VIYLETSCLMKLLVPEPESPEVQRLVGAEEAVVISSLTELETEVQFKAGYLGGRFRAGEWQQLVLRLAGLRQNEPFTFRTLGGSIFETALRQHRRTAHIHCRSLDRLHLAAMEELGLKRLLTNDSSQAAAARDLGFEVIQPGRG
jgi:predicted nucleic acid-binding protein